MELLIGQAILFVLGIILIMIAPPVKENILSDIMEIIGIAFILGPMVGLIGATDIDVWTVKFTAATILTWIIVILGYVGYELLLKDSLKIWRLAVYILVVTIVAFTMLLLNVHYSSNIEITEKTAVVQSQENELVAFENVPVQSVSGSISGEISGTFLYTNGEISGSITTSDKVQYMYINHDGDGEYGSAPTEKSKIRFIEENEVPHLEITTCQKQKITVNHNNGKTTNEVESEWKEYIFYLPKSIFK